MRSIRRHPEVWPRALTKSSHTPLVLAAIKQHFPPFSRLGKHIQSSPFLLVYQGLDSSVTFCSHLSYSQPLLQYFPAPSSAFTFSLGSDFYLAFCSFYLFQLPPTSVGNWVPSRGISGPLFMALSSGPRTVED